MILGSIIALASTISGLNFSCLLPFESKFSVRKVNSMSVSILGLTPTKIVISSLSSSLTMFTTFDED